MAQVEEGFLVTFRGDETPLENASKAAATSLDKVDKAATTTAGSLGKMSTVSAKVSQAASAMGKSAATAGGQLDKAAKISNSATQSLGNLSRVAQDAPYGFIGIANNLNPLLEGFQRLKVETGSTKTALTAMVSSLAGPAGIGLALGVVSSLLVTFGGDLFKSKDATKEQTTALDALNASLQESADKVKALDEGISSLQRLGDINLKVAGLSPGLGLKAKSIDIRETLLPEAKRAVQEMMDELAAAEAQAFGGHFYEF